MPTYHPSDMEITSFCNTMLDMYSLGQSLQPDLIIFPLRGAYPFFYCYDKIASFRNDPMPPVLLSPLGTHVELGTGAQKGVTKPQKIAILNEGLEQTLPWAKDSHLVLLVDEVMLGGTILEHYWIIQKYFELHSPSSELRVCAIEDGRSQQRGEYTHKAERYGFTRLRMDHLFVMDREQYLPSVLKSDSYILQAQNSKLDEITERLAQLL